MSRTVYGLACEAWDVLAQQKSTITYTELGKEIGHEARFLGKVLDPIQDHCLGKGLPPLSILVVNQQGIPGDGFIAYDINHLEEGIKEVLAKDFTQEPNPFSDLIEYTERDLEESLLNNPDQSEDIYNKVKSRGIAQKLFRDIIMKVYNGRCAITGVQIKESLEACHIIPWSVATDSQKVDVRNGILLNSFHHKLFDNGMIEIDSNYRVRWAGNEQNKSSDFEKLLTVELDGLELSLPNNSKHYPNKEYLKKHSEYFK